MTISRNIPRTLRAGLAFNAFCETYLLLLIPTSMTLGFVLQGPFRHALGAVPWFFACMTFTMGLGCGLRDLGRAMKRPAVLAVTLATAHVAAPLMAFALGRLLFGAGSAYTSGLVMFAAIPLGVTSLIWIAMAGGQKAAALAAVVIDSALSPVVVPFTMLVFCGRSVPIPVGSMMRDLVWIVVVPTMVGVILNSLTKGAAADSWKPVTAPVSKLSLFAILALNSASIFPYVHRLSASDAVRIAPSIIILVALLYAAGIAAAIPMRDKSATVTLGYGSAMRNNSLGLVIAMAHFGPATTLPVTLSILLQQPAAALWYKWMQRTDKRRAPCEDSAPN